MPTVQSPKVVILGAGSLFFGRKAVWQMVHSPVLREGSLTLIDTDSDRLDRMKRLAERVIEHHRCPLTLEASTDRREVLAGADFVVMAFADRNAHFRGIDVEVSAKYGIRMCSGDTIGPGGIMRTCREYPHIVAAARDVERLCPEAWVVNYINPAAVHGIGLRRHFPRLKSLTLCDAQWHLARKYADLIGVPEEDLTIRSAGPNHFTWLLQAEHGGVDVLPRILDKLRENDAQDANVQAQGSRSQAKGYRNNGIAIELHGAFGVLPTVLGHTKEYVRYYQHGGVTGTDRHPSLKLFEVPARIAWTERVWARVDDYLAGRVPIGEFDTEFGPDPATDLIEGMWANDGRGSGRRFFVNQMNQGAIPNMADDAFVELLSDVSMQGVRPLPCPPMPRGVRGLCEQILDTHELTAEAVYRSDRGLLRRALLTDPLSSSIGDTDVMIDELMSLQRDAVSADWFVEG
ncbi:MAG: glycoside hydrolase family 4 [Planctomycetota bacterium]